MMKRVVTTMLAAVALAAGFAATDGIATVANAAAVPQQLAAAPTGPGGSWGRALPVAGLAAIGAPSDAYLTDVSCGAPGDCAAVGWYDTPIGPGALAPRPLLVDEVNGVWGAARPVPGVASFGKIFLPQLDSVSCPSSGNCTAAGRYVTSDNQEHLWVITETRGTWGTLREISGIAAAVYGYAVYGLSCASAGNCAVVGTYQTLTGPPLPFIADETGGVWGAAHAVTGFSGLGKGSAFLDSVSCPAPGDCAAGGYYRPSSTQQQAFVVSETEGTWGAPLDVPGTAKLAGSNGDSGTSGISCASPGNCIAGGPYGADSGAGAFIVNEAGGTWGDARAVPGPGGAEPVMFGSLSCASPGDCAIAGSFADHADLSQQVFVADEVNGTITSSQQIPGTAALNTDRSAQVLSVSCAPDGSCAVGGQYASKGGTEAFVVTKANGTWGTAEEVPGIAVLNHAGQAALGTVSCTYAGYCSGIGSYMEWGGPTLPFLVNEATATSVHISVNSARASYGDENRAVVRATVTASGGKPTGTVTITNGTSNGDARVCTLTLTNSTGTCALGTTSMQAGIHQLAGWYNGDPNDVNATSAAVTFTVTKAATRSALTLARTGISYGHEGAERLTVAVAPQFRGTPAGKVTIKAGRSALCTITLKAGKGSCALTARQLKPGTYRLTAGYSGSVDFTPSVSPTRTLSVTQ
jgi:hypothetical protein